MIDRGFSSRYGSVMNETEIKAGRDPWELAQLIQSLEDQAASDLRAQLVLEQRDREQAKRPHWQEMETVDFAKLDDDNDWSDV